MSETTRQRNEEEHAAWSARRRAEIQECIATATKHATLYSERRRGRVMLCETDRIPPWWEEAENDSAVTCPRCLHLIDRGA